ncbi:MULTISPECIES: hypothetical protein [unclassified Roseateles]|uniref:hypothetical protein n=1 Tax=Pelomonas sp. Root1237 TaxID=1736434 RepID=UPI0006FD0210|nr:hypothetical protein [Pelomonas sp. Root1237]KQV88944.1 hypothetical protein ASC91_09830 [Pelomonas sp. Root1237]
MPIPALQRRLIGLAALAVLGVYHLTRPAHACGLPRPASAVVPESAASAAKRRNDTALRFDPPAAGKLRPTRADYEDCIDHPSLDGLVTDCSALLPETPAKPARPAKAR